MERVIQKDSQSLKDKALQVGCNSNSGEEEQEEWDNATTQLRALNITTNLHPQRVAYSIYSFGEENDEKVLSGEKAADTGQGSQEIYAFVAPRPDIPKSLTKTSYFTLHASNGYPGTE